MLYSKDDLEKVNLIDYGKYPILEFSGSNDESGFQIFTPRFIVDEMLVNIGMDYICDSNNKILEPASGDGAFTVRILELRLKKIIQNGSNNFLRDSLIALSTIYSIEMDQELIIKQRNNIFTLLNFVATKEKIKLTPKYIELATLIIKSNFVWGETNVREPSYYNDSNFLIGWYMPTEIKKNMQVPKLAKIETKNLFGETEYIEIPSEEMINVSKYKYNRTKSNQIKFCVWSINDDLSYTRIIEPIKAGD